MITYTILTVTSFLFRIYYLAIFVYVLLSWFPGAYQTKLGQFLIRICEPYLNMFRFIPPIMGVSFAPIIAIIFLEFVERGFFWLVTLVLN